MVGSPIQSLLIPKESRFCYAGSYNSWEQRLYGDDEGKAIGD
jgi:hypothetical protein